jgi:hypothetical protein
MVSLMPAVYWISHEAMRSLDLGETHEYGKFSLAKCFRVPRQQSWIYLNEKLTEFNHWRLFLVVIMFHELLHCLKLNVLDYFLDHPQVAEATNRAMRIFCKLKEMN